jgi:hypothetical protein
MALRGFIRLNKLPLWISIIAGVTLSILSVLGLVSTERAVPSILGLLALISFDALIERMQLLEGIDAKVSAQAELVTKGNAGILNAINESDSPFSTRDLLNARESYENFLRRGDNILISGLTLVATIGPSFKFFTARIKEGATLRFLLLDEKNESLLQIASRVNGVSVESLRNDVRSSLAHFDELRKVVGAQKRDSVQVRLLKTLPTASITMVAPQHNPNFMTGEMRCELYIYNIGVHERPAFQLSPNDDVFSVFKKAVEELWENSGPYQGNET